MKYIKEDGTNKMETQKIKQEWLAFSKSAKTRCNDTLEIISDRELEENGPTGIFNLFDVVDNVAYKLRINKIKNHLVDDNEIIFSFFTYHFDEFKNLEYEDFKDLINA